MTVSEQPQSSGPDRSWFETTHWSVVLSAGADDSVQATEALELLCRTYWYPLYAYARRQGKDAHAAQDLTQGFFERLLEKNYLNQVDRERGKFRSFLLMSYKHFLSDQRDYALAAKRGGGRLTISLDDHTAEDRYLHEPVTHLSPDKIFERHWAMALLERALCCLREESFGKGNGALFDALKVFLSGESGSGEYKPVAERLGMNASAVAVAVHRLRHRYRELVRAEIANTVARPADVEEEMRHLFAVLTE